MLPQTDKGLRDALLTIDRHEDCLLTRAEAAWMCRPSGGSRLATAPQLSSPALSWIPFMGSGTTGKVAQQYGRDFIGIELSAEYLELAGERFKQSRLFS